MASITKLYLRDPLWSPSGSLGESGTFSGTMPGTASLDILVPDIVATGATANRTLSDEPGTAQTSATISVAGTAAQDGWFRRFVSDPLNAGTIGAQTITYSGAHAESNAASDFIPTIGLYLWRPSTGTLVGSLLDAGSLSLAEPGTTQTAGSSTATSKAQTAQAGDVLVLEVWRKLGTQVNTASRANTVYYDGTTEGSTTSVAAFVSFATAVSVQTRYQRSTSASLGMAATLGTAYTPAPVVGSGPSLTAVLTHTE